MPWQIDLASYAVSMLLLPVVLAPVIARNQRLLSAITFMVASVSSLVMTVAGALTVWSGRTQKIVLLILSIMEKTLLIPLNFQTKREHILLKATSQFL